MSESKGITNNASFAALVGAVAVPLGSAVWSFVASPQTGIVAWLSSDIKIANWMFWMLAVWSAFATVYLVLRHFAVPDTSTVAAAPVSKKKVIPYAAYTSDVFFGLRWRWSMTSIGQFFNTRMFCLNCDYELGYDDFDSGYGRQGGYCRCGHCAEIVKFATESVVDLVDSAQKLAEKKIRSGEWEKAVKSELRATKDRALRQQSP